MGCLDGSRSAANEVGCSELEVDSSGEAATEWFLFTLELGDFWMESVCETGVQSVPTVDPG